MPADPALLDGREGIEREGFSYLPRFVTADEAEALIDYFARLPALWEQRYVGEEAGRGGEHARRLTRPVYWLGAWQFACLGYYTEPDYLEDRCLRAEGYPEVIEGILERLRPITEQHLSPGEVFRSPTSALINFYGSELGKQPVDKARLRPHRDGEPGPVVMFSIGQPAAFEFVDGKGKVHEGVWMRHRSACVFSGPLYKDTLYHQITRVKHGREPELRTCVPDFRLRRVSLSFRHVPEAYIHDWAELSPGARKKVGPYVEALARHSEHYRLQLAQVP